MADRRRGAVALLQPHGELLHGMNGHGAVARNGHHLTASAQLLLGGDMQRPQGSEAWQDEVWDFYEALGEFNYGVEWFGEAMSRVRLTAAKVVPGGDEPELLEDGPAVDLVSGFVGGTDGQASVLQSFGVQLSVPGDCYLVGREISQEDVDSGTLLDAEVDEYGRAWTVQPVHTLRRSQRSLLRLIGGQSRRGWDIQTEDARWTPLPTESLVCRVWNRNERFPWRAMSPAKAALTIMREIDMYNRQIIASLVSRVALNGMLLIPDEVTLPTNPLYQNSVDPFVAELIDIMRAAIKSPGSPASAAPLPVRIPAEYIEKFKHLTFATPLDQKLFEYREQALRRLATTLNLPAEIITGMGDVNHWSSWQLSEDAIKIHISPKAESVTRCLTVGYLHPMLQSLGEPVRTANGERIIVWYDTSELTQRPDRSDVALKLREMLVITDAATRRETGFDEADEPSDDELEKMILMKLAVNPMTAPDALRELTGLELLPPLPEPAPVVDASSSTGGPVGDETLYPDEASTTGPPDTLYEEPPPPDAGLTAAAWRDRIVRQTHSSRRRARLTVHRR